MKNATVIEKLNITEAEMKAMRTIITGEESYSRKVQKRREAGIKERQEYLAEQKEQTEDKLWQLQQAIERYPAYTNRQLAEHLNISIPYVKKLKQKLK
ncbi:hypothetical protein [Ectobacillus funiculus]|uniref:hypothetical protein n=1 Tax=Ectobacillus funiculus TaxID=137993 RepID=UPI00196A2C1F|nr:hypothetical protein [Ectobacillus funiculus]